MSGLIGGQSGGERGSTAGSVVGVSYGAGVPNRGVDVLCSKTEHFRELHGHAGPSSSDIDRSRDQVDSTVVTYAGNHTGLSTTVAPESNRDPSALVLTRRPILQTGVITHRLQGFLAAYGLKYQAVYPSRALDGGVTETKIKRINLVIPRSLLRGG